MPAGQNRKCFDYLPYPLSLDPRPGKQHPIARAVEVAPACGGRKLRPRRRKHAGNILRTQMKSIYKERFVLFIQAENMIGAAQRQSRLPQAYCGKKQASLPGWRIGTGGIFPKAQL